MRASSRSVAAMAKRALQGAVKTFRSGRYFGPFWMNRRIGWARMKVSATYDTCLWNLVRASIPKGAATGLNRAMSANCRPIIASPTNPSATEGELARIRSELAALRELISSDRREPL
jgi:hypothetical protein